MVFAFPRAILCISALIFLSTLGCGHKGIQTISGTVNYGGQPVEKGTITFQSSDGTGPVAAAKIIDGQYSLEITSGEKQVKILGFKVVGQRPYSGFANSPPVEVQQQIIPSRYNDSSELTCEITRGENKYNFDLK